MPPLRRHRRNHRARAPKRRKRSNLVKFIPEADSDFALTANWFLSLLKDNPACYGVTAEDVAAVAKAVGDFRDVLAKLNRARVGCGQSPMLRMQKDEARAKAEVCVRTYANIIRANPNVNVSKKKLARIKVRPARSGKRPCPQSPPHLDFLGSGDGVVGGVGTGSGSGIHVLRFTDRNESVSVASREIGSVRRAKPDGAVRVELFFDMVPVGEPVPRLPNERGWQKYIQSYTRSPIEVAFPITSEPMLFVYWAKWADSMGRTSRFSKPCVARVEGWTSSRALPESSSITTHEVQRVETKYVVIQAPYQLTDQLQVDAAMNEFTQAERKMLASSE
jgi:hypothetical protein